MCDIVFSNVKFSIIDEKRDNDRYINGRWDIEEKKSIIYAEKANNVTFKECEFSRKESEKYIYDLIKDNCVCNFINTDCEIK